MNFTEFTESGAPNAWIKEPSLNLYVRNTKHINFRTTDFDLANLSALHPGHGAFTLFLDTYEPNHTFFVEHIMNKRLVGYLMERGYEVVTTCPDFPSMQKP
jgi:hypothetical protein